MDGLLINWFIMLFDLLNFSPQMWDRKKIWGGWKLASGGNGWHSLAEWRVLWKTWQGKQQISPTMKEHFSLAGCLENELLGYWLHSRHRFVEHLDIVALPQIHNILRMTFTPLQVLVLSKPTTPHSLTNTWAYTCTLLGLSDPFWKRGGGCFRKR